MNKNELKYWSNTGYKNSERGHVIENTCVVLK